MQVYVAKGELLASARTPRPPSRGPGPRMKLGDFEIHALSDGTFCLDGGQMFGVVPKTLWERKIPADDRNRIRLALTCLLVRTGRENVLIETGLGDKYGAKFAGIYGVDHGTSLLDDLRR